MLKNDSVKEKFREILKRWRLFEPSEGLLVAVSGGIDSIVLLHLLNSLSPALRPEIHVAHFNHRLRGRASDAEEKFVRALSHSWKIPFHSGRSRPWRSFENVESRARDSRYAFLRKTAVRLKIKKIAVAHQADDQAETFLIRWLQGAGLRGLSGISMRRSIQEGRRSLEIIRPLLFTSRREIAHYAKRHCLGYCEDPTNTSNEFLRSRVRKLMGPLKKENPNLAARNAVNALFLQADDEYLEKIVGEIFQREAEKKAGRISSSIRRCVSWPAAVRFRFLQRMARELIGPGYALPAEGVLKLDELLKDEGCRKHYDLPSGIGFLKEKDRFELFIKK